MKTQKQLIGTWGEDYAVQFLQKKRYTIIERNFRIRSGEIDIIAWNEKKHFGKTLCFIEVKTRSYGQGSAERATGKQKLQNLFVAARTFCLREKINMDTTPIQFEQVSVYGKEDKVERVDLYVIPIE